MCADEPVLIEKDSAAQSRGVLVVIGNRPQLEPDACALSEKLGAEFRIFVWAKPLPEQDQVSLAADECIAALRRLGVKWVTLLGVGEGTALAQLVALREEKLVRRLLLVDAQTRVTPSFFTRFIDAVEKKLPAGLPFRSLPTAFDSRSFLQQIRCPTLVVLSGDASLYLQEQGEFIAKRIPNAWLARSTADLDPANGVVDDEIASLLMRFIEVPAKRPQKAAGNR